MPRITVAPHTPALAADFNAVSDQSVMTFATAAARSAALPTVWNGAMSWLNDTKRLYVFTDGTWYVVPTAANTPRVLGGVANPTSGAGGFFSITHGLGYMPAWAQITMSGAAAVTNICKVQIQGLDASIISCMLVRTDSGAPQVGGGAFACYWTVGSPGANA